MPDEFKKNDAAGSMQCRSVGYNGACLITYQFFQVVAMYRTCSSGTVWREEKYRNSKTRVPAYRNTDRYAFSPYGFAHLTADFF
jgi:hypothetical protein